MHCQFLSGDGKFLLEGVGTELVQIPLINGIVDSLLDTHYVHCLLYFVIISLGILTLCKFSSSFEYVKCLSTLVTERFKK